MSLNARPAWERLNHTMDYAKFAPTPPLKSDGRPVDQSGIQTAGTALRNGMYESTRTATMLDTALLIASALSLALMVVFSELP